MNKPRRILFLLMTIFIWVTFAGVSYSAIIINAPMTGTDSTGWVLGGNPTSSLLTGNGTIDPVGSGWLRLTSNSTNQTGYAYNTTAFDLSQGLLIQFDYATWGGTGADGYSIFLFDAGVSTFNIGAFGGSLGYAQKTGIAGISGGYIGIGVDEYGNFSNPTEGRYLGPGAQPNTVTVRGSVVGFGGGAIGQTTSTTSYPWIATSANNGSLWYNGATWPVQTSANYRKVIIQISAVSCPSFAPTANVWIQFGYNTAPVQMITNATLPTISCTQSLMVGYAASTGASTNYHEIRNLLITNGSTSTAIDLGIAKSVVDTTTSSTTATAVGDGIQYIISARNYGPNNITATGVGINDSLPASITGVTWTCTPSGGATCGTASGSGNTLNAANTNDNLPYGGAVTYTFNGTVSAPTTSVISNTASLIIPGSVTDYNSSDDNATASIAVANLATSTKTVVDTTSAGAYAAGDTLQYTITLKDNGGFATSGVSVSDTIDANLTWSSIVSCPSGATCSYSGGVLTVTGISIPANGSVTIVYNATISGSATPGTTINNTATITNPNGTVVTPAAPVVTVTGTIAVTGNKPLYLYGGAASPYKMSRYPTPGTPTTAAIAANGGSAIWNGNWNGLAGTTLPLQLNDTITSATAVLYINGSSNNARTVSVRLYCSSNAAAYASWPSANLPTNPPVPPALPTAYTFNLTTLTGGFAFPATCATPNYWVLQVFNNTTTAGRTITVVPVSGTNISKVTLASNNVINVNSIGLYSAAYPSAAALTSVAPGQTVYIRATISDPFGSYDITGASLTLTDSGSTVRLNAVAMPQVNDSGAATKIYEYQYTVPATGVPAGNWSIKVTAAEGTEGTVTDTGYATMPLVIPPVLTVVKSVSPNPSINPGQVITYTVVITNTGNGTATNVIATDFVPTYTTYVANSTLLNGITVAGDGSTFPLIAGLLVDNNSGRSAGVAATGVLPAGATATITFQMTVK